MRLCPKCGSKELMPVVFGKKTDHSKIVQKKIEDGVYLLVRKEPADPPNLACRTCGFKWRVGGLPLKYLKKVRFKVDEFGTNNFRSGDRIIEIFPDGKVKYYAHIGSETRASTSVAGKVTKKCVNELFKKLDEFKNNTDFLCLDIMTSGRICNLQMLYVDNDKTVLDGDFPDNRIFNSIMEVAGAVPEIKEELDTPFKDVDLPEGYNPDDYEDDGHEEDVDDGYMYLKGRKAEAKGKFVEKGFLVLAGSKVALDETKSCSKSVHDERAKYFTDGTFSDGILTRDLLFKGIARACSVITGGIGDGRSYWKYVNGESVNDRETRHIIESLETDEDWDELF